MVGRQAGWSGRVFAATILALCAAPAAAFDPVGNATGDGSDTNNLDHIVLGACPDCAVPYPLEDAQPLDTTLSLGLRGSYTTGSSGNSTRLVALPSASVRFDGSRHGWSAGADAELSLTREGQAEFDYLSSRVEGSYQLDQSTVVSGSLVVDTGQSGGRTVWREPGVAVPAEATRASGDVSLSRDIGPFTLTATGEGGRTVYGPETLDDSSVIDVTHRNNTRFGAGLRASYAIGPIVSVFADLNAARQVFDAASPSLSVFLDNDTYEASVGARAEWGEVASVEGEVGVTHRQFDDPGIAPVTGALVRASASWRPNETLTLTANASYGIAAETATGVETTPIETTLSGEAAYAVNPWLTLRGSAGWTHVQSIGASNTETRYDLGLGADYLLNTMTRLSAEYTYSHRQRDPDPPESEHRASVGVTFSR